MGKNRKSRSEKYIKHHTKIISAMNSIQNIPIEQLISGSKTIKYFKEEARSITELIAVVLVLFKKQKIGSDQFDNEFSHRVGFLNCPELSDSIIKKYIKKGTVPKDYTSQPVIKIFKSEDAKIQTVESKDLFRSEILQLINNISFSIDNLLWLSRCYIRHVVNIPQENAKRENIIARVKECKQLKKEFIKVLQTIILKDKQIQQQDIPLINLYTFPKTGNPKYEELSLLPPILTHIKKIHWNSIKLTEKTLRQQEFIDDNYKWIGTQREFIFYIRLLIGTEIFKKSNSKNPEPASKEIRRDLEKVYQTKAGIEFERKRFVEFYIKNSHRYNTKFDFLFKELNVDKRKFINNFRQY